MLPPRLHAQPSKENTSNIQNSPYFEFIQNLILQVFVLFRQFFSFLRIKNSFFIYTSNLHFFSILRIYNCFNSSIFFFFSFLRIDNLHREKNNNSVGEKPILLTGFSLKEYFRPHLDDKRKPIPKPIPNPIPK